MFMKIEAASRFKWMGEKVVRAKKFGWDLFNFLNPAGCHHLDQHGYFKTVHLEIMTRLEQQVLSEI